MTSRPKVRFLTAIWGQRYIREFAAVSLPSYLAPGNLPLLADHCDLEVLVMTSEASRAHFEAEPLFTRLTAACPVRFIYIDDLITTGVYGVTLTLAYTRGILSMGAAQTDTHFVFMNSDFVLADGAFRELLCRMQEGHPCIMAPSLRAQAESVMPALAGRIDPATGTLVIAPRQLVRIAFDNLHPTVIGKTVSQDFVTCRTHNQVYYQVDSDTLLARYHLIFMLAIKPERPMQPANSYCDYGFVPELVPSGKFHVLDDSDRFFMLEMQSSEQELSLLRCGMSDAAGIAKELSSWTTREHRRFASVDVVFHAGDLPPALPRARTALQDFMRSIDARMRRRAKPHKEHYYWASGVEVWCMLRALDSPEPIALPPELALSDRRRPWLLRIAGQGVRRARHHSARLARYPLALADWLGIRMPRSVSWDHLWLDRRLALDWATQTGVATATRTLLVTSGASLLSRELSRLAPFSVELGAAQMRRGIDDTTPGSPVLNGSFDAVLMHVFRSNVRQTRNLIEHVVPFVRPGGQIAVFVEHLRSETDPTDFSVELASYILDVLPASWIGQRVRARFAGGRMKRRLRQIDLYLLRRSLSPTGKLGAFVAAALRPAVALATLANNLRLRSPLSACPPYCSSALLSLRLPERESRQDRRPESGVSAVPCSTKDDAVQAGSVVIAGE